MDRKNVFTVPNLLSFSRLLMVPLLVAFLLRGDRAGAFCVLALSALTDVADGCVARAFHMVSDLGKVLDPLADKVTQAALIFSLALRRKILFLLFGLLFVRESVMAAVGGIMFKKTGRVSSSLWYGKLSTVSVYLTAFLILVFPSVPSPLLTGMTALSCCLVLLSMFLYCARFTRITKEGPALPGSGETVPGKEDLP